MPLHTIQEAIRFPKIKSLYREFESHALWLEHDPGYRTVKNDPSHAFMLRLRGKNRRFGPKITLKLRFWEGVEFGRISFQYLNFS
ncbi:MAG: hypothetical protein ABIJ96_06845 [Elusimicrobiota bacterium]